MGISDLLLQPPLGCAIRHFQPSSTPRILISPDRSRKQRIWLCEESRLRGTHAPLLATVCVPCASQENPDGSTTLFIAGGTYEVVIDSEGAETSIRKYYAIGGQRVMREDDANYYLLTDHLGSVVGVADGGGDLVSEQRYMPYGTPRLEPGIDGTDFGFTGQRSLEAVGMMDYDARWYETALGRFTKPDSSLTGPWDLVTLNRYVYVNNNPVRYSDPTGHYYCEDASACTHNTLHTLSQSQLIDSILEDYGVATSGENWKQKDKGALVDALYKVGSSLGAILEMSSDSAFRQVYGGMTFELVPYECIEGCWGRTLNAHNIRFYSPAAGRLDPRLVVHELGHAFNAAVTNVIGKSLAP